jgi:hypothetical protein
MGRDGQKQEEMTRSGGWVVVKRDSGKCVGSGNGCARVGFAGARSIIGQSECNGSYIPYRPLERCVGETLHVSVAVKSNTRARQSQAPIYPISTTTTQMLCYVCSGQWVRCIDPQSQQEKIPQKTLSKYTTLIV